MQDLQKAAEHPLATKTSWPVGFSRWLETAADSRKVIDPTTVRCALLKLGDETAVRRWIEQAIGGPKPAEMRDFVVHLGRLSLHYWRPDFTPEQAKLMFQDFARDLAHATAAELEHVCEEYRRDAANKFFPTPGKLLKLLDHQLGQRARDKIAAQRILEIFDGKGAEADAFSVNPLPTVAEVLARAGRSMPIPPVAAAPDPLPDTARPESSETAAELRQRLAERGGR